MNEEKTLFANGANWVRVDLHLHSPGISTFRIDPSFDLQNTNVRRKVAEDYVKGLKSANIRIGAITDYNGIRIKWFDLISEYAKQEGIIIFPGVEVSIKNYGQGLHFPVILERNINLDGFNRFLQSLDTSPEDILFNGESFRALNARETLDLVIQEIRERYNCLIIFPHPEDENGLFKAFQAGQAAKFLKETRPDAVEYISKDGHMRLVSTGVLDKSFLKSIAVIESSDPHNLDEIGTKKRDDEPRATYFKLSSASIDALKLALHDIGTRIRFHEAPRIRHIHISGIYINGTNFLQQLNILVNPCMNTLIGGRGVGKSALIETIRYVLHLAIYAEKSSRIQFVESVLGSGGEASIEITRFYGDQQSKIFKVSRIVGDDPVITDEERHHVDFTSPREIFENSQVPILIGQKELYHLAMNRTFLLRLVDQIIGTAVQKKLRDFRQSIDKMEENAERLLGVTRSLRKRGELAQELRDIQTKIKVFEELGVVDKSRRYTDTIEDEMLLKRAVSNLEEIAEHFENRLSDSLSTLKSRKASLRTGKSELSKILNKAAFQISQLQKRLEDHKKELLLDVQVFKGNLRPC